MTRNDYQMFANILGSIGARAERRGRYQDFYVNVYRPFVDAFASENPHFNPTAFSHATAVAMGKYLELHPA